MDKMIATDYDQPVAYDRDGRPLYAHPAGTKGPVVAPKHTTVNNPEANRRHEVSVKQFPSLNLSEGEYVLNEVPRHVIGMLGPVLVSILVALLVVAGLVGYPVLVPDNEPPIETVILPAILLIVLVGLGAYITVWVFKNNRFYLTNESIIQRIQTSLFSKREQTVSLKSIEDASYAQTGIVQILFGYGTIRLTTVGDEQTYRFTYVSQPKKQIAILNNAVEAFKNGKPFSE